MSKFIYLKVGTILFTSFVLLTGCAVEKSTPSVLPGEEEVYRPPTSVPQTPIVFPLPSLSPTLGEDTHNPLPTSTPECTAGLRFLEDLTIPDGTILEPGQSIDKRWLVENIGTCNWDERFSMHLIAGPPLNALEIQALYPARSGTQAVIRIRFTAPIEPGTYRSAWQAFSPQGESFGDMIYIDFSVSESG